VSKAIRLVSLALLLALLAAILVCALAPSSYMAEMPFIPNWLGIWGDANPNFRNMPVFAVFSGLLFFVAAAYYQPPACHYCLWQLALGAFLATAALGAALECVQTWIPSRWADPLDVIWSILGAVVGASASLTVKQIVDATCRTVQRS
jgi:hypothetical protein